MWFCGFLRLKKKKRKKEIPVYMVMVMNVTFAMTESSNLITQKLSSVVAVAQQVI